PSASDIGGAGYLRPGPVSGDVPRRFLSGTCAPAVLRSGSGDAAGIACAPRETGSRTMHRDTSAAFRALHQRPGAFVIPNPWDVGSARFLASLGFEALATTSAGYAFSRGLPDGGVGFDEMIAHCRELAAATPLPVSADLEKGKGDSADSAAETVFAADAAGLAG